MTKPHVGGSAAVGLQLSLDRRQGMGEGPLVAPEFLGRHQPEVTPMPLNPFKPPVAATHTSMAFNWSMVAL